MPSLLRLEKVTKSYPTGGRAELVPLKGIDFEVSQGERVVLLGKSGSGKSTFLNIVGGVDQPTRGKVFFDGRDLTALTQTELAQYRRREVGFVFQSFNLFSTLTVGENVMLPLDLLGKADETKAREILCAVELEGHWEKYPEQLSGGEQQRLAIARALVKQPRLILADEPTGNLDLETGNRILELIDQACRSRHATLIMVTHSSEALWLADRTYRLRAGKLLEVAA